MSEDGEIKNQLSSLLFIAGQYHFVNKPLIIASNSSSFISLGLCI